MSSAGGAEITTVNVCVAPSQESKPPSLGASRGPHFLLNGFSGEVSLLNQNKDLPQRGGTFSNHSLTRFLHKYLQL